MDFEERLSTLEREKQRIELHVMMMEDTILGMKRENKSLKEMFIELLESCETISNHENQFTDLQMKFKSLTTESETGSEEIKMIKTNLNALQNRDMKSFEKHAEHKRDIAKLKGKISAVEKLCKEKESIDDNENARDPCDKCRECVDLCVNISKEMSAIKDDKLYYSSQVEKYEGLLADYRLTMDPHFTEQEIDAIINTEHEEETVESKFKTLEKKVGSLKKIVLRMESNQDAYVQLQPPSMRSDSDFLFSPGDGIMGSLGLPQTETLGFKKMVPVKFNKSEDETSQLKKEEKTFQTKQSVQEAEVFIGNIPQDCDESDLLELFSKYGNIIDIKITRKKDKPNFLPSYGFISFDSADAVDAVLADKPICLKSGFKLNVEERKIK